jgi:hypothetical protein
MFVLGIDANGEVCGLARNPRHRSLSWLKVWELVDLAAELGTSRLAIVVRSGGRACRPSVHEVKVFSELEVRALRAGVVLVDCVVWRGEDWWSLRELREGQIGA